MEEDRERRHVQSARQEEGDSRVFATAGAHGSGRCVRTRQTSSPCPATDDELVGAEDDREADGTHAAGHREIGSNHGDVRRYTSNEAAMKSDWNLGSAPTTRPARLTRELVTSTCRGCSTTATEVGRRRGSGDWPDVIPIGWSLRGETPTADEAAWCTQCSHERRFDRRDTAAGVVAHRTLPADASMPMMAPRKCSGYAARRICTAKSGRCQGAALSGVVRR